MKRLIVVLYLVVGLTAWADQYPTPTCGEVCDGIRDQSCVASTNSGYQSCRTNAASDKADCDSACMAVYFEIGAELDDELDRCFSAVATWRQICEACVADPYPLPSEGCTPEMVSLDYCSAQAADYHDDCQEAYDLDADANWAAKESCLQGCEDCLSIAVSSCDLWYCAHIDICCWPE